MSRYIPLNPKHFSALRWQRFTDYRHARDQHLIPLAAPEVSRAAAHLPLVFGRDAQGKVTLCALTGLYEGVNHCLDTHDKWQAGYVPARLRSHPFRLLAPPNSEKNTQQRVLCADVDSPWVSEQGEQVFLDDHQQMAPSVQEVFSFLSKMAKHYVLTERAVQALNDAGILTPWPLADHQGNTIGGLLRVDEAKLAEVSPDTLVKLHKTGALAIAYGQAISTHQLATLRHLAETHDADYRRVDLDAVFDEDDDELMFDFS